MRYLDFVNNVIYDWGFCGDGWDIHQQSSLSGYGFNIAVESGSTTADLVDANIINNYFLLSGAPPHIDSKNALVYPKVKGAEPGQYKQGTVFRTPDLGHL